MGIVEENLLHEADEVESWLENEAEEGTVVDFNGDKAIVVADKSGRLRLDFLIADDYAETELDGRYKRLQNDNVVMSPFEWHIAFQRIEHLGLRNPSGLMRYYLANDVEALGYPDVAAEIRRPSVMAGRLHKAVRETQPE